MNADSEKWHRVISIKVLGVTIDWDGEGCSIENRILKNMISQKASQLEDYVSSVGLLECFQVRDRFDQNGATIEVYAMGLNEELFGIEHIGEELHRRFVAHRDSLKELYNPANNSQTTEPSQAKSKMDYAAVEAMRKFQSGVPGTKMEIDFSNSGTEFVHPTKSRPHPAPLKSLNHNAEENVTGDVRFFDEVAQKVTLYNLVCVVGQVTLDVDVQDDRKTLLDAQKERRQVVLKFTPAKTQHGEQARAGKLISIEAVGDAREKLL